MTVEPIVPDAPAPLPSAAGGDARRFTDALDALGATLSSAQRVEDTFAYGGGSLHEAVYERARADVALSIATSAAQHAATALNSILNMQV